MNDTLQHPNAERLRAFSEGRLGGADLTDVSRHLEGCPVCCAVLEEPQNDPLVSRLRSVASSILRDPLSPNTPRPTSAAPPALPGYEILSELGRGGMGVVYKARQVGLNRVVALKVLLGGAHASPEEQVRFRAEASSLARLRHPNIVQVYDTGTHDGLPYFALEYVDGSSLAARLRGRPLTPRPAAALVETLARAVEAAHRAGVVHRDLKPQNVLLHRDGAEPNDVTALPSFTLRPSSYVPRIVDFGLAKCLDSESGLTRTGTASGTPSYMAPEQAWGRAAEVGPAADIYGLGATLYELLTGRPPFQGPTPLETMQQLRTDDPVSPRRLQPQVPRDLETICLKCLEKQPRRRYASAAELADDLRRFLDREPVRARPAGPLSRATKWALRRPAVAGLLLLVVALAAAGVGGVLAALAYAFDGWEQARKARNGAQRQSAGLLFKTGLEATETNAAEGLPWMLAALQTMPDETAEDRAFHRMVRVNLAAWGRLLPRPLGFFEGAPEVACVAFSPDGRTVATGHHDGSLLLWDAQTGRRRDGPPMTREFEVVSLAFHPDGRFLLAGYGKRRGTADCAGHALCWDIASGQVVGEPLQHELAPEEHFTLRLVSPVAWSPDGLLILTGYRTAIHVWEAKTHRPAGGPWPLGDVQPFGLAFGPEGQTAMVATGTAWRTLQGSWSGKGDVQLWDLKTGRRVATPFKAPPDTAVHSLAWSADGSRIVAGGSWVDSWLVRWAPERRERIDPQPFRLEGVYPRLTPDGQTAILRERNTDAIRVWDLASVRPAACRLAPSWLGETALHPDGEVLARGPDLWRLPRSPSRPAPGPLTDPDRPGAPKPRPTPLPGQVDAAFTPDRKVAAARRDNVVQCWDTATGQPAGPPVVGTKTTLALSPDGRFVAGIIDEGTPHPEGVRVWDSATGQARSAELRPGAEVRPLAFSPRSTLLAVGTYDYMVHLYEVDGTRPGTDAVRKVGPPLRNNDIVLSLAFSPDGRLLAVGTANDWSQDARTQLWDLESRQPVGQPMPMDGRVRRVLFRPDGRAILSISVHVARLWEIPSGEPLSPPIPVAGMADVCGFAPDSSKFATAGANNTVRVHDGRSGAALGPPLKGPAPAADVAFSPDGGTLLVGYDDGSARLWDVATWQPIGPPVVQRSGVLAVAWSSDGQTFWTVGKDAPPRSWPVPQPLDAETEPIRAALELTTTLRMDASPAVSPLDREAWLAGWRAWKEVGRSLDEVLGPPLDDVAWHDARARDAEEDGEPFAARWHLNKLLARNPDDWHLLARRAATFSSEGLFEKAESDYVRAARIAPAGAMRAWLGYRYEVCRFGGFKAAATWYRSKAQNKVLE